MQATMRANRTRHYETTESLTSDEIRLVRDSYDQISVGRRFARNFYGRLFDLAPDIRVLFPDDMSIQVAKLMEMLSALVRKLDAPHELMALLRDLGLRHRGYGVEARHFAPVGRALFETLTAELGPRFDDATRGAWISLYALASAWMQVPAVAEDPA